MAQRQAEHRIVAYTRVSTDEQGVSGLGLAAQRTALEAEIARRGVPVDWVEDAGFSAKSLGRPGIQQALDLLAAGKADTLLVAKLDRATRSVGDLVALLEKSRREGWAFVALDVAMDSSTPAGEATWSMMGVFSQLERRLIGARTRDALAVKKAQGVRLGRPVVTTPKVAARITQLRSAGLSLAAVAATLNADGISASHGGRQWWPSSVSAVLVSQAREP
jgi:DNA invertase Pin-like site-specific DNA recombinase